MEIKVTYENNKITIARKVEGRDDLIQIIDLINSTITDVDGINAKLDDQHVYTFRQALEQLGVKDENLLSGLFNCTYYDTYCSTFMGGTDSSITDEKSIIRILSLFSNMVCSEQYIDAELYRNRSNPKSQKRIKEKFFKKNSESMYNARKLLRLLLIIPGLVLSPVIILVAIFALRKMS